MYEFVISICYYKLWTCYFKLPICYFKFNILQKLNWNQISLSLLLFSTFSSYFVHFHLFFFNQRIICSSCCLLCLLQASFDLCWRKGRNSNDNQLTPHCGVTSLRAHSISQGTKEYCAPNRYCGYWTQYLQTCRCNTVQTRTLCQHHYITSEWHSVLRWVSWEIG